MLAESMGSIRSLLSDATFPMLSYFAGAKFGSHIARILGEHTRIEDLWIPYFLVTTNLSQADMCVHETGRLWKAVRASMTVLDYLPPMQMSRSWPDLLIDGGYTNNLPVDVMHGLFQPRYVIGVDVENKASEEKIQRVSYFGTHLSGWWLLRKRLTEWIKDGWMGRTAQRVGALFRKSEANAPPQFFHLPKFAERQYTQTHTHTHKHTSKYQHVHQSTRETSVYRSTERITPAKAREEIRVIIVVKITSK